jgi:hypothetical protein
MTIKEVAHSKNIAYSCLNQTSTSAGQPANSAPKRNYPKTSHQPHSLPLQQNATPLSFPVPSKPWQSPDNNKYLTTTQKVKTTSQKPVQQHEKPTPRKRTPKKVSSKNHKY